MAQLTTSAEAHLSPDAIDTYWKDGVIYPLTAMDEHEAESLAARYYELRERMSNWTNSKQLLKVHLVSRWAYEVASNSRILDAVECILGPDILLWGATFFAKKPNHAFHVGWHQDLTYWGLHPADGVVTVWLGLTDACADNGAMQVVKGSHLHGARQHEDSGDKDNMLMSSQMSALTEDDEHARLTVELRPGQFSMHHSLALHGSAPNRSERPRIGVSINYIATEVVQQKNGGHDTAMLVRGRDSYGHFELETPPQSDFSQQSIAQYRHSIAMPSGLATRSDVQDDMINFQNIV